MALFLSTYENKVDKKGRVSVPASFRTAVAASHFSGVALYQHLDLPCLEGADISFLETLSSRLYDNFSPLDPDQLAVATMILGASAQLGFDTEGRIMLPASMRSYTGIDAQAVFVGIGPKFQIWEPAAFEAHRASLVPVARAKAQSALSPRPLSPEQGGRS